MRYLLDTDHLSILQRQSGADYHNLVARMAQYSLDDFAISIITIQEQMLGCHAYINRARYPNELVKGYDLSKRFILLASPFLRGTGGGSHGTASS
jgi:tRNA(fMet)-specific endonuclease VapC